MPDDIDSPPQNPKNDSPAAEISRFLNPMYWNAFAIFCSVVHFFTLGYLIDIGMTAPPSSGIGNAIYQIVNLLFPPFQVVGVAVSIMAITLNARTNRWKWNFVIFMFSFIMFAYLITWIVGTIQFMFLGGFSGDRVAWPEKTNALLASANRILAR